MSFVTQDDIKNLIEALLQYCWPPHLEPLSLPLPRLSYADAIQQYGSDKPDTRYGNLVIFFIILVSLPSLGDVTIYCVGWLVRSFIRSLLCETAFML